MNLKILFSLRCLGILFYFSISFILNGKKILSILPNQLQSVFIRCGTKMLTLQCCMNISYHIIEMLCMMECESYCFCVLDKNVYSIGKYLVFFLSAYKRPEQLPISCSKSSGAYSDNRFTCFNFLLFTKSFSQT